VWDDTLPASTVAFAAGKSAMYIGPSWRVFEIINQNPQLKFRIVPIPQVPKDDPNEPDITYATYWAEGVWENSPNKEAAWDFLKFLSTKENLEKMYTNASKVRKFGEPYPRVDMKDMIASDPNVGPYISLAPNAKSWYLASRTYDGPTGINTLIGKYYQDAINKVTEERGAPEDSLRTAASGIQQVLAQYGLYAPQTQPLQQ
jgi:ABC-type glycerol-3-phosphate transport system substrate-binding protein